MSSEEDNLKNVIIKQNEQFFAQKNLIEQQLDFANNIQKKALETSIGILNDKTKNVKNKKNANNSAKPSGVVPDDVKKK